MRYYRLKGVLILSLLFISIGMCGQQPMQNNDGKYSIDSNPDSTLAIVDEAVTQLRQTNNPNDLYSAHKRLGEIYKSYRKYDLALNHLKKAYELTYKMDIPVHDQVTLLFQITQIYYLTGQAEPATTHLDSTLQVINQSGNKENKISIYHKLGDFFRSIKRYDKALAHYKNTLELIHTSHNIRQKAQLFEGMGALYQQIYNYAQAINYYEKALEQWKQASDTSQLIRLHNNIGGLELDRKKYNPAAGNFTRALELIHSSRQKEFQLLTIKNFCKPLIAQGKYLQAKDSLAKYLRVAEKMQDFQLLSQYHRLLADINKKTGPTEEALEHQSLYHAYNDSVDKKKQQAQVDFVKIQNKLDSTQDLVQIQNLKEAVNDQKTNQNSLKWGLALLVFLLIVLAVWFMYTRKKLKENYSRQLKQKNETINKTQKQLNEVNQDVEAKINERTQELQKEIAKFKKKDVDLKKALKDAEDANYLKNAFLSNMSHEIRTPLNGIIGFSSLLETELSLMENTELYEYAQGIQTSGERLLHLLNNIIDISRIEANDLQVSLQETNLKQIVEKSAELFKFKANEKGLKFNLKLEETPMVYADPSSLSKVISDIIDNSVKYTEKGFINITSGYDNKSKEVYAKIRDTGVGIDDNYLPKIFEAFRQESLGYSRAYQGAGLGLPLAKRLLDLMDGRIEIDSKKNEGTTIIIYLPTKEKADKREEKPETTTKKKKHIPELTKPLEQINILLVEDDRMNRLLINKMLDNEWTVVSAEDGDSTLKEVDKAYKKNIFFDIMLFDINLPSPWDGIKLMQHIRNKYPDYKEIPFIAQTAYAMRTDRTKLLEEGFDEYISKPINQQRLLTMIYNFLSNK